MKTALLIDGDMIAYRYACACETAVEWEPGLWTYHAHTTGLEDNIRSHIDGLLAKHKAELAVVGLTAANNWRKEIFPDYKSNRASLRKPLLLEQIKTFMRQTLNTWERPTLEADDVLGILAGADISLLRGFRRIIVSEDKDFLTIPGLLYRKGRLIKVSEEDADRAHLFQTLVGDAADGYPGCPGVGPTKANKLLDKAATWETVLGAFKKAKLTEDDALTQARIARICRTSDYDFKRKEVILWSPPS